MYQIGEFSKIAQVSGRQLRHYDQLGLLAPTHTDSSTGYRYYSASQLPQLNRILALKEMGLSLDQIKRMVDNEISPDELRGMLMMKKAQIEQSLHEELARMRYIESRIDQINIEGNIDNYDIVMKSVPAKKFLAVREICLGFNDGRRLAQEMFTLLPSKVGKKMLGHPTAIVHSDIFVEENIDLEFGFQLEGVIDENLSIPLSDGAEMTVSELPAEEHMVTITRLGNPKLGHGSYSAVGMWAEVKGYQFAGNIREVFINFPSPDHIEETVTEIQFPVKPIEGLFPQLI
jgi:DNA-binding transcriptional MerR regulator